MVVLSDFLIKCGGATALMVPPRFSDGADTLHDKPCGSATLFSASSPRSCMGLACGVFTACVSGIKECGSTTQRLSFFTVLTAKAGGG
ncbi:hypothetical protein E5358_09875 [Palleniella muris]|uniref:Uncharacterized protein n=1 Tax=Palleniella muris TaxID=3038145 RepID=A0AC61QPA8_9BACT|nr:hypothetical protein [Palleniella muris]TGX81593.1 hypothetical protein E5358_09875 [Palleniella muris]